MKIIAVANQKGGAGKTTTAIELGYCLADQGNKVLLIDFDQQRHLSMYLGIPTEKNIYKVMTSRLLIQDAIVSTEKVDVIAASGELSNADKTFTDVNDIYLLEDICAFLKDNMDYDYVVIDNSPARDALLTMSYVAADYIVAPTTLDDGSVNGIIELENDISKLRDGRHKISHAQILAIILIMYEHTNMHEVQKENLEALAKNIKGQPIIETVRKSVKMSETKTFKKALQDYDRYNNAAIDYRRAVENMLKKMGE